METHTYRYQTQFHLCRNYRPFTDTHEIRSCTNVKQRFSFLSNEVLPHCNILLRSWETFSLSENPAVYFLIVTGVNYPINRIFGILNIRFWNICTALSLFLIEKSVQYSASYRRLDIIYQFSISHFVIILSSEIRQI